MPETKADPLMILRKNEDFEKACKRCGRTVMEHIFSCPVCHDEFCSCCFGIIVEGDGSQIKCPKCGQVLALPPHPVLALK